MLVAGAGGWTTCLASTSLLGLSLQPLVFCHTIIYIITLSSTYTSDELNITSNKKHLKLNTPRTFPAFQNKETKRLDEHEHNEQGSSTITRPRARA